MKSAIHKICSLDLIKKRRQESEYRQKRIEFLKAHQRLNELQKLAEELEIEQMTELTPDRMDRIMDLLFEPTPHAEYSEEEQQYTPRQPAPKLPDSVIEAFNELGHLQRGKPEEAMLQVQYFSSGVLPYLMEHIGDLTHRMTEHVQFGVAGGKPKIQDGIRHLTNLNSFTNEHIRQLRSNAQFHGVEYEDFKRKFDELALDYANAHAELPVYNTAQKTARDAAVALGRQDFRNALTNLQHLYRHAQDENDWWNYATQYELDEDGRPKRVG